MSDTTIDKESHRAADKAPAETYEDITRVMDTEIKTCPAVGQ